MRLYLSAKSKLNIGYTPDWLKVTYEQDGKDFELTLDIQGEIGYSPDSLDCRCKGELIPWVVYDLETGNEVDLYSQSDKFIEMFFPDKKIAEIVCNSDNYEIGIYPVCDTDEVFAWAEDDDLTDCEGRFEMYIDEEHQYAKDFKFETELNIY
jgi:hypothetical protein